MRLTPSRLVTIGMPLLTILALPSISNAFPVISGSTLVPMISAGAPPDSPSNRVDPNTPNSRFSGVVSINVRYANGDSFICSGTLVSSRDVVTAGHCLDSNGQGRLIDIRCFNFDPSTKSSLQFLRLN